MPNKPQADAGLNCPLYQKDVSKVCHKCVLYVHIRGKNPQTEEEMDHWNCSLSWTPMLLIENSQRQMQTAASIDALRKEAVVRGNEQGAMVTALLTQRPQLRTVQPPLLEGKYDGH